MLNNFTDSSQTRTTRVLEIIRKLKKAQRMSPLAKKILIELEAYVSGKALKSGGNV